MKIDTGASTRISTALFYLNITLRVPLYCRIMTLECYHGST